MEKFKKIWFVVLLGILFMPMLQARFHFFEERPLDGAFVEMPKPQVTLKTLFRETVQDSLSTYCTEQSGFRKSLIRLNNQMLYSAFGKISAIGPVKGKDGKIFFEESYIISYTGETYLGAEKIDETTRQLKLIQEMLKAKHTTLLPVFVLGKASYYPELIPDKYIAKQNVTNNYGAFRESFAKQGLNYIDFNRYFCSKKGAFDHAIYCDLSAHWTVYAASIAVDSIVRYMEQTTQQEQVHPVIEGFRSDYLMNQDDDLYRMMNIIAPLPRNIIDQPDFSYTEGYKPKVLAISDSYWWTVWAWNVQLPQNLFSDGGFWFYNRTVYPERSGVTDVTSLNYKEEIEGQDFVLLVCTEATNHLWPYGFIERYLSAYDAAFIYKGVDSYDAADSLYATFRNAEIEKICHQINDTPEWLENVSNQAKEKGVPLEQMVWDNAEYTYRMKITPKGFCH